MLVEFSVDAFTKIAPNQTPEWVRVVVSLDTETLAVRRHVFPLSAGRRGEEGDRWADAHHLPLVPAVRGVDGTVGTVAPAPRGSYVSANSRETERSYIELSDPSLGAWQSSAQGTPTPSQEAPELPPRPTSPTSASSSWTPFCFPRRQ